MTEQLFNRAGAALSVMPKREAIIHLVDQGIEPHLAYLAVQFFITKAAMFWAAYNAD